MSLVAKQGCHQKLQFCFNVLKAEYSSAPRFSTSKAVNSSSVIVSNGDLVGQPNPVSNLRPVVFHIPKNESDLEKKFRLQREHVQNWNEEFWSNHNTRFIKERKKFLSTFQTEEASADDMSIFYKAFLDKYWRTHLRYNVEWYKKNATLISLALQVKIERMKNKMFS